MYQFWENDNISDEILNFKKYKYKFKVANIKDTFNFIKSKEIKTYRLISDSIDIELIENIKTHKGDRISGEVINKNYKLFWLTNKY